LTEEKLKKVKELLATGKYSRDKISDMVGVSNGTVSKIKAGAPVRISSPIPKEELSQTDEITGDTWNISLPKTRICTLDELVEHCKIDLGIWEVERFICNKWEVGAKDSNSEIQVTALFQVKAFLKKKKATAFAKAEIEALRQEAMKYSPKFTGFRPKKISGSGVAVEFAIYDHHYGGLIWGEETGGEDWDNKIASYSGRDALESLVNKSRGFNPEMAVLVLGHDRQNADNRAGSTENLTPQSMDSRYHKVYNISKTEAKWSIDKLLAEYGRVHVIMVPGNHDPLATFHLGDYLATWYRNCPGVTIDNSVPMRKWWEWGVVMLMLEHGNKGKLPDYDRIMSSEKPEMWGRTKWREAHTGDKHHKTTIETKGAIIRSLSSLRPSCAWSTENHHTGSIRAAEAFIWSKTEGLIGQATYSILKRSEEAA
jgi:hypothetical protein